MHSYAILVGNGSGRAMAHVAHRQACFGESFMEAVAEARRIVRLRPHAEDENTLHILEESTCLLWNPSIDFFVGFLVDADVLDVSRLVP